MGCILPGWFTFENPFGGKERDTEASLMQSRAQECSLCTLVRQGLGVEGEGGEGCVTCGAGGSGLPGLPFRNVCSLHAPWAASAALRCSAGSAHGSPKVRWGLQTPLAGSRPGLGEGPSQTAGRAALCPESMPWGSAS